MPAIEMDIPPLPAGVKSAAELGSFYAKNRSSFYRTIQPVELTVPEPTLMVAKAEPQSECLDVDELAVVETLAPVLNVCDPQLPSVGQIKKIIEVVCSHYGVRMIDLLSARRTARVVKPRQIAMYLAKTLTLRSLPEIGRRMGGRDHTTVLHAVRKMERLIQENHPIADEISEIRDKCMAKMGMSR